MAPMLVLAVKLVLLVFILDGNLPSTCHAAGWLSPGPHGEGKTLENLVGWASVCSAQELTVNVSHPTAHGKAVT